MIPTHGLCPLAHWTPPPHLGSAPHPEECRVCAALWEVDANARADEQDRWLMSDHVTRSVDVSEAYGREQALTDLRAKVEGLPVPLSLHNADCPGRPGYRGICDCEGEQVVRKRDVLALIGPV